VQGSSARKLGQMHAVRARDLRSTGHGCQAARSRQSAVLL